MSKTEVVLLSTITCPSCQTKTEQTMPEDACQFFWQCPECEVVLKPKPGDCCVFCSFGTVACPPIQLDDSSSCCG